MGGRRLYVIVTLRFDFHIGSVEWVTCHAPESQAGVGGVKAEAWGVLMVVGARRTIWEAMDGGYSGGIGSVKGVTGDVHKVSVPEIPRWGAAGRMYSTAMRP